MTYCFSVNVGSWIVMQALDLEGGSGDKVLHIECISSSSPYVHMIDSFFFGDTGYLVSVCVMVVVGKLHCCVHCALCIMRWYSAVYRVQLEL